MFCTPKSSMENPSLGVSGHGSSMNRTFILENCAEDDSRRAICHSHAILCESLQLLICYDQVDVSNLAKAEQIVRRIIQDGRAIRKNPKHPDYSGLEFVLNQTTDLSGAATTAVFNRWYTQIQRDEAAVLMNARQHCEELDSEVKRQTRGGGGKEGRSPLGEAMTSPGSKGLPDDDDRRPQPRGVGHREHGGPFPLPPPEIMPIRAAYALARYLRRTQGRKRAQQRLIRESVIALNSLSNSA